MSSSIEIFSTTTEYLEGRITLYQLESWLAPRLPMYMISSESPAAQMTGLIELCLAELHDRIRTERSIKTQLRLAIRARYAPRDQVIFVRFPGQTGETVSSSASSVTEIIAAEMDLRHFLSKNNFVKTTPPLTRGLASSR